MLILLGYLEGKWKRDLEAVTLSFMISSIAGHCQEGWFLESRFCYKFFNDVTADWNQAVTSCEEKGAYLTNLASTTDVKLLRDLWISAGWNETLEW